MKEEGLEKVSSAIALELDSMLGGGMLTREGMLDGTAPLLDMFCRNTPTSPQSSAVFATMKLFLRF
jgi:hypothetical protein